MGRWSSIVKNIVFSTKKNISTLTIHLNIPNAFIFLYLLIALFVAVYIRWSVTIFSKSACICWLVFRHNIDG